MMRYRIVLLILLTCAVSHAQTKTRIQEISAAYSNFEYDRLDSLTRSALENYSQYKPSELFSIHLYAGSACYSRGQINKAKEHFAAMLSIDPNPKLDPVSFSPKIIELIDQLKLQQKDATRSSTTELRYILVPDKRPDAAKRSLLLPGWGQRYKGEKLKGNIISGAAVACVAGIAVSHLQTQKSHEAYLKASESQTIQDRYNTFSAWSRTRSAFIWSTGIVWAGAFLDAVFTPAKSDPSLTLNTTAHGFALTYHF